MSTISIKICIKRVKNTQTFIADENVLKKGGMRDLRNVSK